MPNTQAVPNLIQGISQQAPGLRRDSQCEAQFDCFNSAKDGAVSRNGADLVRLRSGLDLTGGFFHEITRGTDEHYLLVMKAGTVRVVNLDTGLDCDLTIDSSVGSDYLAGSDFCAQTVDDYTFVANRSVKPAMSSATAETRPAEALVFFKAGDYSMTYTLKVTHGGTVYAYSYTTPDNSSSANYAYIHTNQLAATFYRALTGVASAVSAGGDVAGSAPASGSSGALPSGFSVAIKGNILRVYRTDDDDFSIAVSDGAGDANIKAFKSKVSKFSDLPKGGFPDMVFSVSGTDKDADDDYYVKYVAEEGGSLGHLPGVCWSRERHQPEPGHHAPRSGQYGQGHIRTPCP